MMLLDLHMKKLSLLFILAIFVTGCLARLPEPNTSQKVVKKYFVKYGKKYPESIFGGGIDRVEIYSTNEIQYLMADVGAAVFTKDGMPIRVDVTLTRKAGGWNVMSWENVE